MYFTNRRLGFCTKRAPVLQTVKVVLVLHRPWIIFWLWSWAVSVFIEMQKHLFVLTAPSAAHLSFIVWAPGCASTHFQVRFLLIPLIYTYSEDNHVQSI